MQTANSMRIPFVLLCLIAFCGSIASGQVPALNNFQFVGQGNNTNLATTIANAGNGGTVIVPAGYTETIMTPVLITQTNLTIKCEHGSSFTLGATITPPNYPVNDQGMITMETGSGLVMDGCTLISNNNINPSGIIGSLFATNPGITNLTLTNNVFTGCYNYCAYLVDTPPSFIHGNTFTGMRNDGIYLFGNANNVIVDGNFCNATGIGVETGGIIPPNHKCVDAHSAFGLIVGATTATSTTVSNVINCIQVQVGDIITGPTLAANTTVASVTGCGSNTFTISPAASGTSTNTTMTLYVPITGNTTNGSTSISSVTNIGQIVLGNIITGTELPAGTVVTGINYTANSITVSQPATATASPATDLVGNLARQINNLTVSNNTLITGNTFCSEIGDFGGLPPTAVVAIGNTCTAANQALLAPVASFTGNTVAGTDTILSASSITNLAAGQNISGPGIGPGNIISSVAGTTVTLTLNATGTQTGGTMVASEPFGGYSFQNVQGLTVSDNSFYNMTGFEAAPAAIEIVGDTISSSAVGIGPTTVSGNTLIGGPISVNETSNVSLTGNIVQQLYPGNPGQINGDGAIAITEANHVTVTGGIIDTRGVGATAHAAIYDVCNGSIFSCSYLSINGVTAIDDGQSTREAYHFGYAAGTDMGNITVDGGQVKGWTSSPGVYYFNSSVTNAKVQGVDDTGNGSIPLFSTASGSQVPGSSNTQLYYTGLGGSNFTDQILNTTQSVQAAQGFYVGSTQVIGPSGVLGALPSLSAGFVELAKAGSTTLDVLGDAVTSYGTITNIGPSTAQPNMLNAASAATSGSVAGWAGIPTYEIGTTSTPINPSVQWQHRFGAAGDFSSTRYLGGIFYNNGSTCINSTMQGSDNPSPCNYVIIRYSTVASDPGYMCVIGNATGQQAVQITGASPSSSAAVLMSISLNDAAQTATCTVTSATGTVLGTATTSTTADYPASGNPSSFVDWNVTQAASAVNVRLGGVQGSEQKRIF